MAKDFTDYLMLVMGHRAPDQPSKGNSDRTWHIRHFTNKGKDAIYRTYRYNGHVYAIDRSRAFWNSNFLPWTPWFTWSWKHIRRSFKEWTRPKKIGYLFCAEPDDPLKGILTPIQPLTFSELLASKQEFGNNTPHTLKAVLEDRSYLRSLKSMPFAKKVMGMKWPIIIIVAIVGIVLLLFFTGVIPMGGG